MVRARLATGTVPSSDGTADYTHADITSWSTKGLALVIVAGNSATESEGGRVSIALIDQAGNMRMSATRLLQGRPTVTDCCNANHQDSGSRVIDDDPLPGASSWARVTGITALTNGVRLTWDVDPTAMSGRTFHVAVVLIDNLTGVLVGNGSGATSPNFHPDAVIGLGFNGSLSAHAAVNNDGHVTLGAAIDGVSVKQAVIVTAWDTAADNPTPAHGIARDDSFIEDFSPPSSETKRAVTAFTSTGFSDSGDVGAGSCWAAFASAGIARFGVALEELDGTTGPQFFDGLGLTSDVVVGVINGNSATNTIQGTNSTLSALCVFVTDGTNTYAASLSQTEGENLGGGNNSNAYSRWSSGSIDMLDHVGGTAFAADVDSLVDGLTLDVSTGLTGRMFLFGFGAHVLTPDPVELDLAVPTATLNVTRTPSPVVLPLVVPNANLGLIRPSALTLPLLVAEPELLMPLPPLVGDGPRPPLVDAYAAALLDLLPRGHAWTRSSESTLGKFLRGLARECEVIEFRGQDLLREADPRRTHELLVEWETFLRTRVDCPDLGASEIERRFAVIQRLTTPGGQNAYHFAQVAQALGYDVEVEDFEDQLPFIVDQSGIGDGIQGDDWRFVVVVHAPVVTPIFFRAGLSQAGEPLVTGNNHRLTCELDRLKPAHVLFLYSFDKPYTGYSPWHLLGPVPLPLFLNPPHPHRT